MNNQVVLDRSKIIGEPVKVRIGSLIFQGRVFGSKLDFPIVCCEGGVQFEITWRLADQAVREGVIING